MRDHMLPIGARDTAPDRSGSGAETAGPIPNRGKGRQTAGVTGGKRAR